MEKTHPRVGILFVMTSAARTSGGGHTFLRGLEQALRRDPRLAVTLVLPVGTPVGPGDESHLEQIRVRPLTGLARIFRDLTFCRQWARRARAHVVVVPHEYAPPVPKRLVVNVVQNILYLHPHGRRLHPLRAAVMRTIIRRSHRFSDRTICNSPESADLWREFVGSDSLVLPQGIDTSFRPEAPVGRRRQITILTGPDRHKNPDLALELDQMARRRWPDWNVTVIGGVPVSSTGASTVPFLTREELKREFCSSHVVVLTSSVESFGLPAFEARACGARVVVQPDTPMAHWLASDEHTVVSAGADASSLLEAVATTISDSSAPTFSTEFFWEEIGGSWTQALIDLQAQESR